MGFLDRIPTGKPKSSTDDYEPLIYQEKALPKPPKSTRLVPFKLAHIARLQEEARQRVKLLADPYCGLPRGYLPDEDLRYFRCTLVCILLHSPSNQTQTI
jgi:hypothetical protein